MPITTKQTSDKSSDSHQISLHPARLVPGVTDEQVQDVLAFEGVPELARFYRKIGWNPEKEFKILIHIVEDEDEKTDTRLRALKELAIRRSEILMACGLKVKATRVQTDPSGVSTVCQADLVVAAMGFGMPGDVVPDELKGVPENERIECFTPTAVGETLQGVDFRDTGNGGGQQPDRPRDTEELVRGKDGVLRKRKSGSGRIKGTKDSSKCKRSQRRYSRNTQAKRKRLKRERALAGTKIKSVLT